MKTALSIFSILGVSVALIAGEPVPGKTNFPTFRGDGGKCYDETSHVINVGIGVATGYYARTSSEKYSSSPYLNLSYEQPWKTKLGPGYLGVGAYFGYKSEKYSYYDKYLGGTVYYYERRYTYYTMAGRAVYHWDVLNSTKAEVYGGVLIGVRMNVYNYSDTNPYADDPFIVVPVVPYVAPFVGARYYFTDAIGVFAEIGAHPHSHSNYHASIGASIKF